MDFSDKTVLITGASSGIGAACAEAFAQGGADLVLAARRMDRLEAAAADLCTRFEIEVRIAAVDVRSRDVVDAFGADLEADGVNIDILVNNAGLARGLAPVHEGDVADWDEMIDTNVKGLLNVTRTIVRGMVDRGEGHVINIGSIAGHETYANGVVYCATKHAVAAITRGLGIDTLGTGVRVSSVDPGLVNTEFSVVRFHGDQERADGVYAGMTPLSARDVADAVLFCASRPAHANVREMVLMPADQAAAVYVHRDENR
ncbi:MAG: SDR family NAD(P)-dependent oxidoreductase [Thermoanaerobaculales bacterium]|nr:SDR family NAD(P)-dependent oxidoreductase [Thermoanaerobaculales bacterium]